MLACACDQGLAGMGEGILDWAGNFAKGFAGQRPVFNSAGVKIGYWTDAGSLCKGTIFIENAAGATGGPATWFTKDDFWRDVPVSEFCKAAGYSTPWDAGAANAPSEAILQNIGRVFDNTANVTGGVVQGTANATGTISNLTSTAANIVSNPTLLLGGAALVLFLILHKRAA